jgi:hypothetical protein
LIDSIDIERQEECDERTRREINDDESDDDDDSMKNAKIDRDDDSVNDLSEIDRRDFFRTKNFVDESHLLNC